MIYIYKTDTVWGIGAAIDDKVSHLKICEIKKTSVDKPVSILFSSLEEVEKYFDLPFVNKNKELDLFFKDKMTLLLPKKFSISEIPKFIIGESQYVGIRCLNNQKISKVIKKIKTPITTTSLNVTGDPVAKNETEAKNFLSKASLNEDEYLFINETNEVNSSEASTILQLDLKNQWNLIRGDKSKLEKYQQIFST